MQLNVQFKDAKRAFEQGKQDTDALLRTLTNLDDTYKRFKILAKIETSKLLDEAQEQLQKAEKLMSKAIYLEDDKKAIQHVSDARAKVAKVIEKNQEIEDVLRKLQELKSDFVTADAKAIEMPNESTKSIFELRIKQIKDKFEEAKKKAINLQDLKRAVEEAKKELGYDNQIEVE